MITFESMEDKQAMLDSCWLGRWFIEISEVDESTTSRWRQTTLSIYGVPLAAWNYENFHNIGSIYGRVILVDYSNFTSAEVMLITDCLFKINCNLHIDIDGKKYPVFTSELSPPTPYPVNRHPNPNLFASSTKNDVTHHVTEINTTQETPLPKEIMMFHIPMISH